MEGEAVERQLTLVEGEYAAGVAHRPVAHRAFESLQADVEAEVVVQDARATEAGIERTFQRGVQALESEVLRREGLTHGAAARQLGVSVRTVSRWVGGETEPRLRDLRRIQERFGGSAAP